MNTTTQRFSRRLGERADAYITPAITGPYRPSVVRAERVLLVIAACVALCIVAIGAASWIAA